jgi:hypothetical protein
VRWERRPEGKARPEELLQRFSSKVQQLTERVRAAVRAAVPEATESVRPGRGYLAYRLKHQFASIAPRQDHVRLSFAYGVLLADPAGLLVSDGQEQLRYVRLERPADARRSELVNLLRLAASGAPPSRSPRGRVELRRRPRRAREFGPK